MNSKKRKLIHRLKNRAFRDAYVSQHSTIGLPFQIRAMRDARRWTQRELGERAGMKQETISLLENPGYGKFTLRTLNRLASALDVGLLVRFVPFSRLVDEMTDVEPEQLAVPSFDSDPGLVEQPHTASTVSTAGRVLSGAATSWQTYCPQEPATEPRQIWVARIDGSTRTLDAEVISPIGPDSFVAVQYG